jgi:uncharacterized Tic20 family protein
MTDKRNIRIARRSDEDATPDESEVIDLDALINDYEENGEPKRKNDQTKRKNDFQTADAAQEDPFADLGEKLGRAGEKLGREFGRMGEQFGQTFGKMGGQFGQRGENLRPKEAERKFRAKIGDFLRTPYAPDYAPEHDPAADGNVRNWAAIAHLFGLISIPMGVFSAGLSSVVMLLVPLMIYLFYRDKSSFAAKHALQALIAQAASTLGIYLVMIISSIVGVVLTVLLAITIIGIVAIPFLWIGLVLFWLALYLAPLGAWIMSFGGAANASQGKTFKYPYVGRWVK